MPEPQLALFLGDPYRCERALAARHSVILEEFPDTERHKTFGDELDLASLGIELESQSLFVAGRHFVVRHAEAAKDSKGLASLFRRELLPATFLTALATELKESSPLLKSAREKGCLVSFPEFKGKALERAAGELLAEQGISLAPAEGKRLVERSGEDLLAISQEVRKLRVALGEGPLAEDAVDRFSFAGGEASVYPLLDRLGEGNLRAALAILAELREDPSKTFASAVRHLGRTLAARLLLDEKTPFEGAATILGGPSWLARRLFDQAGRRTSVELATALDCAIGLDLDIKAGLIRPADALLELVLVASSPATRPALGCAGPAGSSPEEVGRGRMPRTGSLPRRSRG